MDTFHPFLTNYARSMPIRQTGASYLNRPSTSAFRTSSSRSAPAGGTDSSGGGSSGFGISVSSRLAASRSAKSPSADRGVVVNTFRNILRPQANRSSDHAGGGSGGGGSNAAGGGATGNGGGSGRGGGGTGSGRGGGGGGGRRGGSGGGKDGGGGGGDGKGGRGGNNKSRGIFEAAAATIVVAKTTQDRNANQHVKDKRKQAHQQAQPFWHDPARNTITSPKGETINVASRSTWDLKTKNVIYGIYSQKTGELVYVGKTSQELKTRIGAHVRDIRNAEKTTDLVKFF